MNILKYITIKNKSNPEIKKGFSTLGCSLHRMLNCYNKGLGEHFRLAHNWKNHISSDIKSLPGHQQPWMTLRKIHLQICLEGKD